MRIIKRKKQNEEESSLVKSSQSSEVVSAMCTDARSSSSISLTHAAVVTPSEPATMVEAELIGSIVTTSERLP